MGDSEYLAAFAKVLVPIALEYRPELVIIGAGFDSGRGDPWGECDVTTEGYANLTSLLITISGGKLVLVLEVQCPHRPLRPL
eukprot:SAG11_NODE_4176_length_2027_cov_1.162344_2_plen_81_part_01